jgi:hypothetical protein
MNTSNNEHDDFIQELIESIYIQLEQSIENTNKLEKFKLIIKGVINFLKENELSINSIRTGLIEFFHLRRSYIRSEYQYTFYQIGIIVENILGNGSDSTLNNELEESISGDTGSTVSGSTASSSTASGSIASGSTASGSTVSGSTVSGSTVSGSTFNSVSINDLNFALQLFTQPHLQNSQPLVYTYQPYMGLPTINVPTSSLPESGLAESSLAGSSLAGSSLADPSLHESNSLSNLGAFLLNMPVANLNDVDDNNEDDLPSLEPVGPSYNSAAANLLLNFVNIYMNGSHQPLAPMVDVKNVVTEKQLEKLKVATYSELKSEEAEKYKDCAICLDSFEKDSKLRILKCDHGFHVDCIDKWLTDCNYKCPVCRDDSNEHHAEI